MKIVQLNTVINSGSTGRIAEEIGKVLMATGHESLIAHGRGNRASQSRKIGIGTAKDIYWHGIETLLLDRHGLASRAATKKFIKQLEYEKPDALGLHNIHGYYLNYPLLFEFIKAHQVPVLWTFHDCWPFTGHCTYFDRVDCKKWKTHCHRCPLTGYYPRSIRDRSFGNFEDKKMAFTGVSDLTIITPSRWLKDLVQESFLGNYKIEVIHNGIDLAVFGPKQESRMEDRVILGVAGPWSDRKGLKDFYRLRELMPEAWKIVLIGLSDTQIKHLPPGIDGIARTESVNELAEWYSKANVFVNPTYIDNFPTTNIEALACGTPVVTYRTGGSPEAIDVETGKVVVKGSIAGLKEAILEIDATDPSELSVKCRQRAEDLFDKNERFNDYLKLYERVVSVKNPVSIVS